MESFTPVSIIAIRGPSPPGSSVGSATHTSRARSRPAMGGSAAMLKAPLASGLVTASR